MKYRALHEVLFERELSVGLAVAEMLVIGIAVSIILGYFLGKFGIVGSVNVALHVIWITLAAKYYSGVFKRAKSS